MNRRIILVFPDPPLPFGGAAARWFYVLLKGLVERGNTVTTFAAYAKESERTEALALFPADRYDLRLYPIVDSPTLGSKWANFLRPMSYLYSAAFRADLNRELDRGFDIFHLEQLCSAWLSPRSVDRVLLSLHHSYAIDHRAAPASSFHQVVLRWRLRRAERRLLSRSSHVRALSPRLRSWVREVTPNAAVYTIPLGMDLSLYPFRVATRPGDSDPVLGLVGSFNWTPSYSAGERLLTRLWPEIKRRVPAAKLHVVGRCAESAFRHLPAMSDVKFFQDVPDIMPYFAAMDALLYSPAVGSGMKVKVLESLALGVPVVTNQEGAEGLELIDGVHAGVSEDDAGLIERAVRVLSDREYGARIAAAGRTLLEKTCGPEFTLDGVEAIYETMGNDSSGARRAAEVTPVVDAYRAARHEWKTGKY